MYGTRNAPMMNVLYFHNSNFRNMCALSDMDGFCIVVIIIIIILA